MLPLFRIVCGSEKFERLIKAKKCCFHGEKRVMKCVTGGTEVNAAGSRRRERVDDECKQSSSVLQRLQSS